MISSLPTYHQNLEQWMRGQNSRTSHQSVDSCSCKPMQKSHKTPRQWIPPLLIDQMEQCLEPLAQIRAQLDAARDKSG